MILVNIKTKSFIGNAQTQSTHHTKTVQSIIDQFRQSSVEILTSNPFRSSASHIQQLEPPQHIHKIYDLQRL